MTVQGVLNKVAEQVNAGALGPNVTASVSPRVAAAPNGSPPRNPAGAGGHNPPSDNGRHSLPPAALDELHALRGGDDAHQWAIGRKIEQYAVEYAGRIPLTPTW